MGKYFFREIKYLQKRLGWITKSSKLNRERNCKIPPYSSQIRKRIREGIEEETI